jgi:hypothetical protein
MKTKENNLSSGPTSGEFVWRSVRYACAVGAGYFCGLSIGSAAKGPGFWLIAILGLLGILWVFRTGKKSVQHAASDAVATARASATAAASAVSSTTVQVGNGNYAPDSRTQIPAEVHTPRVVPFASSVDPRQLPPGVSDGDDFWNDYHSQFDSQESEVIDWEPRDGN